MPTTSALVAVLLGTRPEAIKLAPVILALRDVDRPHLVVATGQHAALARDALDLFGIVPDIDLGLMRSGQSLDYVLATAVTEVGALIEARRPAAVLVQGDTTSMLGSALAAFHHRVPVGHVEAGLRSGDLRHPFPEEMNRRTVSHVVRWHFAPTASAAANLAREGLRDGVHITGNTVVDALRMMVSGADLKPPPAVAAFLGSRPYILATAHRRESWDGGIARIAAALRGVLDEEPELRLVFVTHPNPIARRPVDDALSGHPRAFVIDAVDYASFLGLLRGSRLVVSDSGGVQEEGPTLGVPVVVTRSTTERPEGVEAGAVELVGTDADRIRHAVLAIHRDPSRHAEMACAGPALYGDGHAAERIVDILARDLAREG